MEGDSSKDPIGGEEKYFNPLPPHGGRQNASNPAFVVRSFQSTPSAWRETMLPGTSGEGKLYFNPLPPHGGRQEEALARTADCNISIHSLRMEGDECTFSSMPSSSTFQSTPSAWRETLPASSLSVCIRISIHSLRMEGDNREQFLLHRRSSFQSTPSAWRETKYYEEQTAELEFQSTPSAWRETTHYRQSRGRLDYFNPLPPHGGRHIVFFNVFRWILISIHSLRMEGDRLQATTIYTLSYFNPLPPHGGRPSNHTWNISIWKISIHSLRMEGDVEVM